MIAAHGGTSGRQDRVRHCGGAGNGTRRGAGVRARGAQVWATDVNEQALSSLQEERIQTRVLDVTDEVAIDGVAREVATSMSCSTAPDRATRQPSRRHAKGLGPGLRGQREVHVPGVARLHPGC